MNTFAFKNLQVWQKAIDFADNVIGLIDNLEQTENIIGFMNNLRLVLHQLP